jgi:hypothetical protein
MIPQEFRKFLSVVTIFVDAQFKVFAELLVEFFEVLSVLRNLLEELNAFLGDVFLNNLQDFVVLKILPGDVKR